MSEIRLDWSYVFSGKGVISREYRFYMTGQMPMVARFSSAAGKPRDLGALGPFFFPRMSLHVICYSI